jgi:phage tail-like protein
MPRTPYSPKTRPTQQVNLAAPTDPLPYTVGRYSFELDGISHPIAICSRVSGGDVSQDVVSHDVGKSYHTTRWAGKPRFNDIEAHMTAVAASDLWEWLKESIQNKPKPRDGTIVEYDARYQERSRRHFQNGVISEVQFPKLDASNANSLAEMVIKISIDDVTRKVGDRHVVKPEYGPNEIPKNKLWSPSNFRLTIDKFPGDQMKYIKVDGPTIKQNVMEVGKGQHMIIHKRAGRVDMPKITVTFASSLAEPWFKWNDDANRRLIKSKHKMDTTGSITYLAPDNVTELASLDFYGVGIESCTDDPCVADGSTVATTTAVLHLDRIEFKSGAGTFGGAAKDKKHHHHGHHHHGHGAGHGHGGADHGHGGADHGADHAGGGHVGGGHGHKKG